jgi:hypothetical protein
MRMQDHPVMPGNHDNAGYIVKCDKINPINDKNESMQHELRHIKITHSVIVFHKMG